MRWYHLLATYLILAILSFSIVITVVIPYTPQDAAGIDPPETHDGIWWRCPNPEGTVYSSVYLDLTVSKDDYESSLSRTLLRNATVFVPSYAQLIDPNDHYVRIIAEHILTNTEGCSDYLRAVAGLRFVQAAIDYVSDPDLYGCDDFPATPTETLYMRAGDCEDSAILLASIYLAMDMDAVLLDYPHHYATGVRWEGQDEYLACQTTSRIATPNNNLKHDNTLPEFVHIDDVPQVCCAVNDGIAFMRYGIKRTIGV